MQPQAYRVVLRPVRSQARRTGRVIRRLFRTWIALLSAIAAVAGTASAEDRATFQIGQIVFSLRVAEEQPAGYRREDWSLWDAHVGGGCFTVRDKVLNEESVVPVRTVTAGGGRCRIVEGQWNDPYTGQIITDAAQLQIDHVVPLKEAYASGGFAWDRDRRHQYANDLTFMDHLIAVFGPENGRKSDRDPADYLPTLEVYRCQYLYNWIIIKGRWDLAIDPREQQAIAEGIRQRCTPPQ